MSGLIQWVAGHWGEITAAVGALIALATGVTRLTPTKKDDAALAIVVQLLGRLSVLHPPGTRPGPKLPGTRPAQNQPHPDDLGPGR